MKISKLIRALEGFSSPELEARGLNQVFMYNTEGNLVPVNRIIRNEDRTSVIFIEQKGDTVHIL